TELYFAGAEVLAIAADTEEHARDAIRAVKIEYEKLGFAVKEADTLKNRPKTASPVGKERDRSNVRPPITGQTDDFDPSKAEATAEGPYGLPNISHQCLESHGLVAHWTDDGGLTVYASTQAVTGTAMAMSGYFRGQGVDLPATKVKCITHYMGGGF